MSAALELPGGLSEARRKQAESITPARVESADPRVEMICDMLAKGEWHRGIEWPLSELWGVQRCTVLEYAKEASRLIRMSFAPERHEDIRNALLLQIAEIGRRAMERKEQVIDVAGKRRTVLRPDMRTALASTVEFAQLLGIRTNKHEVRVNATDLSDAELHERLAKIVEADPGLQEKLASIGFKREVETTGTEVPEKESK